MHYLYCACMLLCSPVLQYIHHIHVLFTPPSKATFAVHSRKRAVVGDLVVVGDGVWISFVQDSIIRLYNGTTFTHMQDLDIAPAVRKNIGMYSVHVYVHVHNVHVQVYM